ncbi:Kelch-like protein 5 [Hordeum vulgare]|nr:Kelch-like protein 5 [Hordeum vulgare]
MSEKRKRVRFIDKELIIFSSMTEAAKEVSSTIKESKSMDVHPQLYGAVMEQTFLSPEALMVALNHLLDNKG